VGEQKNKATGQIKFHKSKHFRNIVSSHDIFAHYVFIQTLKRCGSRWGGLRRVGPRRRRKRRMRRMRAAVGAGGLRGERNEREGEIKERKKRWGNKTKRHKFSNKLFGGFQAQGRRDFEREKKIFQSAIPESPEFRMMEVLR
jgi:hypothetical protein